MQCEHARLVLGAALLLRRGRQVELGSQDFPRENLAAAFESAELDGVEDEMEWTEVVEESEFGAGE